MNFVASVAQEVIQALNQVYMGLISKLNSGISRVLQILKSFKSTAILTSFVFLLFEVFFVIFALDFNY